MFSDQETCIAWLERVRWKGEPVCAHCGACDNVREAGASKPHTYWCGHCRKYFRVTTGTIMHATKTPLQNWIIAIYSVMTARKGVSAMQISKELGVQYRTAWYMLHRIREACASDEFKQMDDVVEMDEVYIGDKRANISNAKRKALADTGRGAARSESSRHECTRARRQDCSQAGKERGREDGERVCDRDSAAGRGGLYGRVQHLQPADLQA